MFGNIFRKNVTQKKCDPNIAWGVWAVTCRERKNIFRMYRSRKYLEVERGGGKEKLLFENRLRKFEFRTNCGT